MGIKTNKGKWLPILIGALLLGGVSVTGYCGVRFLRSQNADQMTLLQSDTIDGISATAGKVADDAGVVTVIDEPVLTSSPAYKLLYKVVHAELRQGRPTYALKLLSTDPLSKKIKNSEYDRIQASIAQSYMIEGMTKRAYDVAKTSAHRSKHDAPYASWVGGLAAWRLNDFNNAGDLFATAAESSKSSSWLKSAAAFWASRAYEKSGKLYRSHYYMNEAAKEPRTFYGLIALKSLDRDYSFNWDKPSLKSRHRRSLDGSSDIQEAITLSNSGDINAAIKRLGKSGWLDNGAKQRQLLAYVLEQDAPALSMHLGKVTKSDHGGLYDLALYPEAPWDPEDGYEVDKAMVNALIRQESRFDPQAKNASGARGLMQLMPSTASYMAKGIDVSLTHPATNIAVGQKYVRHLLMDPSVNNDLIYMAIAYNAGPGNLARWKKQYRNIKDPLLFVESIPSAETRAFVERVMVNYWIYRIRMGKDNPSLDAVASGYKLQYVEAKKPYRDMQLASEN